MSSPTNSQRQKTWWQVDHHLWTELKKYRLEGKNCLVALSGGVDSLALAQSFFKVLGPEKMAIAHFHHGGKNAYRDEALEFCQKYAVDRDIPFFYSKWEGRALKSEAEFRKSRYEFLFECAKTQGFEVISTAHQAQDVLETRLIRLIRGTGPQGLKALEVWRPPFFRPFLSVSKKNLEVYLNKEDLKALTDPSNSDNSYLRNWLRQTWLPQLESYKPGSCESLGRSLENLVQNLNLEKTSEVQDFISRAEFLAQTESEQKRWLAAVLLHRGQKNFTQFHLEEIRRRVLQSPKNNTFRVAGCQWLVNAEQIRVQPLVR